MTDKSSFLLPVDRDAPWEERLAVALEAFARFPARGSVPGFGDQYRAAEAGAEELYASTAGAFLDWPVMQPSEDEVAGLKLRRKAYLMAAIAGCRECVHIRDKAVLPGVARLDVRLLLCERCAQTERSMPPNPEGRCYVCGMPGNEEFAPFTAQVGPYVVVGTFGACCGSIIGGQAEEPAS